MVKTKKTTQKKQRSQSKKTTAKKKVSKSSTSLFTHFISRLFNHPIGRVLLTLFLIASLIGLTLLLTMNKFERFFIALAIECILAALFAWIFFIVKDRQKNNF